VGLARPRHSVIARVAALLVIVCGISVAHAAPPPDPPALIELGRALFFDPNLSLNRTQSCATCHDPEHAFSDGRDNGVGGAVSLGADGHALGDRNAPSLSYAARVPPLHRDADGEYAGGLFHDGRTRDLVDQAEQPMLNPVEMAMPGAAAVVERVNENPSYPAAIAALFDAAATQSVDATFAAVRTSLAAFEHTPLFVAFDSRYDRYLKGAVTLTADEEFGRMLFFSALTSCSTCHALSPVGARPEEPFTNFGYFNIGVPINTAVRARNGHAAVSVDRGLRDNPAVTDDKQSGRFRVPTLRNVAVTAPYMHNGVFRELATVVFFYNQYLVENEANLINPETHRHWGAPEIPATVDRARLRVGQPMDDERIAFLVAFLRTLTDQRFEVLLEQSD